MYIEKIIFLRKNMDTYQKRKVIFFYFVFYMGYWLPHLSKIILGEN